MAPAWRWVQTTGWALCLHLYPLDQKTYAHRYLMKRQQHRYKLRGQLCTELVVSALSTRSKHKQLDSHHKCLLRQLSELCSRAGYSMRSQQVSVGSRFYLISHVEWCDLTPKWLACLPPCRITAGTVLHYTVFCRPACRQMAEHGCLLPSRSNPRCSVLVACVSKLHQLIHASIQLPSGVRLTGSSIFCSISPLFAGARLGHC